MLLLPLVGFLPVDDPRIAGTIAAIERDLMEGGLVRRKPPKPDGHDEGAFLACSCWLADCYKMQGRDDEAAALLERVIGLSNDVGLLSEEYDVAQPQPDRQYSSGLDASGPDQHRLVPFRPGDPASRRMMPRESKPIFLLVFLGSAWDNLGERPAIAFERLRYDDRVRSISVAFQCQTARPNRTSAVA